jgi:myo-inositol 2-dehydrogenase / D-chiro-inositol 1-dehydrogenase
VGTCKPLGVGVIGCGWVAENGHLPALARIPDADVVALADPDPARLNSLEGRFTSARRHPDHRNVVDDPAVDAVVVCVPTRLHVEVARAAAEAGKHVLLEKPPALTLGEWDRLAGAVQAAGITLMVGLNMRWHPPFRALRDLVRGGAVGRVRGVLTLLANDIYERPDPPSWRRERRQGGGALMEMGVHHLDLWRFLLDEEIEEIFAVAEGDDDSLAVSARMGSGVPVSALFSQRTVLVNEVGIYGERGYVRATPHSPPRQLGLAHKPWAIGARAADLRAAMPLAHVLRIRRLGGFYVASFVDQWRHFIDAVKNGSPVEVGIDSGRRLLQATLAAAAAASDGHPVACSHAPAGLAMAAAASGPARSG